HSGGKPRRRKAAGYREPTGGTAPRGYFLVLAFALALGFGLAGGASGSAASLASLARRRRSVFASRFLDSESSISRATLVVVSAFASCLEGFGLKMALIVLSSTI